MAYDVIVCGAGPGGAYAAYMLARRGRKVAIVEKEHFPRFKPCGGILRPGIIEFRDVVNKLGKFDEGITYSAALHSPSGKYIMRYRSAVPLAYHVRRETFDAAIAGMACDAGAELIEDAHVKSVGYTLEPDNADSKVEFMLSSGRTVAGRSAIGAGGVHCPVAKFVRARERVRAIPQDALGFAVVAEVGCKDEFVKGTFGRDRETHLFFTDYYGYGWVFPKKDAVNFGIGAYWRDAKEHNMMQEARKFSKMIVENGLLPESAIECVKFRGGILPTGITLGRTFTDRIVVIGDAAGFASPLTGEGIYYAMLSGKVAAEVMNRALDREKRGGLSRESLQSYERAWKERFGLELRDARGLANLLFSNPEKLVRLAVDDLVLQNCFADCFSAITDPGKVKRRAILRVIKRTIFG